MNVLKDAGEAGKGEQRGRQGGFKGTVIQIVNMMAYTNNLCTSNL
jgi:hypothetical protein